jgi:glutathione S-transferase
MQFKLHYFNLRGRGEVIRLIFALKNVKYEDYRVRSVDWPQYKKLMPAGKLPVLEIKDGSTTTFISQSKAIGRFLANKYELTGAAELDRAKVDEIVDQISDEQDALSRFNMEKDENLKAKYLDDYMKSVLPVFTEYYENVLKKNNTGFLVIKVCVSI